MSVTVRPYVNGGWEVDIRVQLPDGSVVRERKKTSASSKQAAQKWAESRERVLLVHGKPKPATKEGIQQTPTLKEFALRFLEGYAKAKSAEAERHRFKGDRASRASGSGIQ